MKNTDQAHRMNEENTAHRGFENGIFAFMGALIAVILGLACFGEVDLFKKDRAPASVESQASEEINLDSYRYPF